MKTIFLGVNTWDLALDVNGNIAVASNPYSLAQDAASAARTFLGECYYNSTIGVPYFQSFLGRAPNPSLMKQKYVGQALLVPEVISATVFFTSFANRRASGQIQITGPDGTVTPAAF
jgi:hypothetical protein